jgi:hypothetical protein
MRLRDKAKLPPGGYRYFSPETNFSISPWISFEAAVAQIVAHRTANPYQCQKNGWSTDPATVANDLEQFNVHVCQQMGWKDWLSEGGPDPGLPKAPSLLSRLHQSVQAVAAGVETIKEWDIEGGVLVAQQIAEDRANICSQCPKNGKGDLLAWFTVPAAELIKKQLEKRNERKIFTNKDPLLGICEACFCPMKLKVHCPTEIINAKLKPDQRAALWENCWILK